MEDFRRADPRYTNFTPTTCMDAIDLFNRHRNLGLSIDLYPECFVHCARELPDAELDKFHRFIVNPEGDVSKGGEQLTLVDKAIDDERKLLEEECDARDQLKGLTLQDDEKCDEPALKDSER